MPAMGGHLFFVAADWATRALKDWYESCLAKVASALPAVSASSWCSSANNGALLRLPSMPSVWLLDWLAHPIDMEGVLPAVLCAFVAVWLLLQSMHPRWAGNEQPDDVKVVAESYPQQQQSDSGSTGGPSFGFSQALKKSRAGSDGRSPSPSRTGPALARLLCSEIQPGTFWLCRVLFLRALGLVYLTAYLVALQQNPVLLGDKGLLPVRLYMQRVRESQPGSSASLDAAWDGFVNAPTLLWFFEPGQEEVCLGTMALLGCIISSLVLLRGGANGWAMAALWLLYTSIVNVGQRWYSFGWESQLLETGFLAIFLVPWFCHPLSFEPLPAAVPTPMVAIWAYRWLIFRIMIGAGLIKIRGDQCWRDLTCMDYHYETQPVPSPISWFLHQTGRPFHMLEVATNHFVELLAPWLLLPLPALSWTIRRWPMMVGGAIQLGFQLVLIISGNLSFLNWLTALPALFCFDDRAVATLFFPPSTRRRVWELQQQQREPQQALASLNGAKALRAARRLGSCLISLLLGLTVCYLSVPYSEEYVTVSKNFENDVFDCY